MEWLMHCHANHMTCYIQWPRISLDVDQTLSFLEGGVWERDYLPICTYANTYCIVHNYVTAQGQISQTIKIIRL